MKEKKKLFQDRRWNQDPGVVVVGKNKVTDEERKEAEEFLEKIRKEENNKM